MSSSTSISAPGVLSLGSNAFSSVSVFGKSGSPNSEVKYARTNSIKALASSSAVTICSLAHSFNDFGHTSSIAASP